MTRTTTRSIAVVLVVLALCSVVVAPAAASGLDDTDSGPTVGDHLDGTGGSPGTPTASGGDDGTRSTSDSGNTDGTESDSSGDDIKSDGGGGSTDTSDDSSVEVADATLDDGAADADDSPGVVAAADSTEGTAGFGTLSDDLTVSPVTVDADDATALDAASTRLSLSYLDAVEDGSPTVTDGTSLSSGALELQSETLLSAPVSPVDGVDASAPSTGDATDPVRTGLDPVRADAAGATDPPSSNRLSFGERAPGGSTPLPPAPTTGLALGVGAVAAALVSRHGALAPGALANVAPAVTASVAPLASARPRFLDRLLRTLAPFRYSRYDDSDPLEHDARAAVYEVVDDAPGAYLSEVADRADLPLSTVRHHVRVLEREDLVSGAKVRGKRRFYPAYTQGIELAAALDDDATAAVIDAVARFGAASVSDIAEELGRDPSTVSHHLKRLAEDGIVVRERDGRAVMNKLSSEARTALEPDRDAPTPESGEALASD